MKKIKKFCSYSIIAMAISSLLFSNCTNPPIQKNIAEEVKYFDVNQGKIAYKIYGKGEPLILCMGYSGNMDLWDSSLIDLFKEKYQVIVFDYRGMGYSTNTDTLFTMHTLADDVNELCKFLKINKANVLGWSMGGYVAQTFAINYPEKVDKLVLYATDCGDTITIQPDQKILKLLSDTSSTPAQIIKSLFPVKWLATHPDPWKYLPHLKEPLNYKTVKLQDRASSLWSNPGGGSADHLHELKMPTLIISGDEDALVLYKNSEILSEIIANSTLIKIRNGGHGLMFQYPKTVGNYVLTFLAQ